MTTRYNESSSSFSSSSSSDDEKILRPHDGAHEHNSLIHQNHLNHSSPPTSFQNGNRKMVTSDIDRPVVHFNESSVEKSRNFIFAEKLRTGDLELSRKAYEYFNAPITKYWFNVFVYAIFIICFCRVVLLRVLNSFFLFRKFGLKFRIGNPNYRKVTLRPINGVNEVNMCEKLQGGGYKVQRPALYKVQKPVICKALYKIPSILSKFSRIVSESGSGIIVGRIAKKIFFFDIITALKNRSSNQKSDRKTKISVRSNWELKLCLFRTLVLLKTDETRIWATEIFVIIYISTFAVENLRSLVFSTPRGVWAKIKNWHSNFWNSIETLGVLFFFAGLVLRSIAIFKSAETCVAPSVCFRLVSYSQGRNFKIPQRFKSLFKRRNGQVTLF